MRYQEHILVVDDDPTLLEKAEQILSGQYRISLAVSGEQALRFLQSRQDTDLILLDILMPGMDGYQTLETIRTIGSYRSVPIIYLTSVSDPESEVRGLNIGAADYVTKPFHPQILIARIERGLNAAGRLDAKKLAALPFPLTENEYKVARLLARSYSNEAICAEMYSALDTVKKTVSRILEKLDIKNRKEIEKYLK